MASIKDRLDEDIRNTMRARNRERLDTLRFLKSQIQLAEKNALKELDDTGVTDVITKQAKDRRESIEMFGQGGRTDLVEKEQPPSLCCRSTCRSRWTSRRLRRSLAR